jgi:hypothetical protein
MPDFRLPREAKLEKWQRVRGDTIMVLMSEIAGLLDFGCDLRVLASPGI